jgi:oligoendopeptidase F
LFTEFELYAHQSIENEVPITNEELNQKYYELNQKYYGNSCVLPENLKYEWSRIPHFYRDYYVFCYSTGLITAISIAQKILNEKDYYKKYINFLKNGTNKKPIDILKEIDIDLTKKDSFENAFKFIKEQLEIYDSLCK